MTPQEAYRIAFVAHGAVGQMRADGVTRYIEHPCRVAQLVDEFLRAPDAGGRVVTISSADDCRVAAYLHDVLEDTKLRADDLRSLGITETQLDIVLRLTKPDDGPAPAAYYAGIAQSDAALVVKCADRASNLEDALAELLAEEPKAPGRWARYVEKTARDLIPLYASWPVLQRELASRLAKIEEALPGAFERRAAVVARERADAGL